MQFVKNTCRVIYTGLLVILFSTSAFAQTIHVKGTIESDTTWTADTVKVDSTVMVKVGARLTILPGTYVEFQGYYPLEVEGELWAVGTRDDTIVFTIRDTTGFSDIETSEGAWHGIRLDGDGDPWVSKIKYCIIEYSKAMPGDWNHNYGGGIYARVYDSLEISHCIIRNNYADNYGGGFYLYGCSARITNNSIYNNRTRRSGGGFGVYFDEPVIINNIICNNYAQSGAGVYFNTADPVFANNIICNNTAGSGPGGLFISDCDIKSINNTICFNKANIAGGIYVGTQAKPVFINNIVWGNEANEGGTQIHLQDFNPEISFYNCNIQGGEPDIGLELGSVYFGEYEDNIDTLPGFESPPPGAGLEYNGMEYDWSVQLGSPCINTGTNTLSEHNLPEIDFAGNRRISYSTIDIGAYEFNLPFLDVYQHNLTENTTWTADTVKVHGNIYIQDTYTLTINPGVMVQFQGPYKIEVKGTLLALGTEKDSIIFTINDTTGFADLTSNTGGWNGIQFLSYATNDSSKILYSRLEYGKQVVGYDTHGGAIRAKSFYRLLISNSTIVNNMAESGGGISCSNAPITIQNTTISNNRALDNGGGIKCNSSNMNIIDCIISNNESSDDGGGVDVYRSDPLIENCIISHNIASNRGGGIYSHYNARPIISRNVIKCNSASTAGGIFNEEDAVVIQNQICNNTAYHIGGVLFSNDGDIVFTGNIVSNNRAENNNGGVVFGASGVNVRNNTIVNNYAGNEIGGITFNRIGNRMFNNIIWGNHSASERDTFQVYLNYYDTLPDLSHSIIQDGVDGIYSYWDISPNSLENVFGSMPGFVQPTDSAGTTFDGSMADWSLKDYSPGINTGDPVTGMEDMPVLDIYGNPRIHDGIIDIGAVENQSRMPVIIDQPQNYTRCTGDTVEFSVRIAEEAVYQWQKDQVDIPGAIHEIFRIDTIQFEHDGNYQCIITNGYGTVKSYPAQLRVKLPPEIYTQPEETWAEADEKTTMNIFASGSDLWYQWRKDSQDLEGKKTDELAILNTGYGDEGSYDCIISNTCGSDTTEPVNLYLAPQLCMVTVDPATGNNLVVWEKKSSAAISHYKIYRESNFAGIYDLLASVPYDDLSVVLDSTADPTSRAFIYKITAVDSSGFETDEDLCKAHKTIHLLVTSNPETKATQLDWDRYVGFDYGTYIIYRSDKSYDFNQIDLMASSTSTWADPDPGEGTKFYRIAAERPESCNPGGNRKKKADAGPFSHAMSNIEDNRLNTTGVKENIATELDIYPNPFSNSTTIKFHNPGHAKYSLNIYDLAGKKVITQNVFSGNITINRGDIPSGIYLIELKGERIFHGNLIIE